MNLSRLNVGRKTKAIIAVVSSVAAVVAAVGVVPSLAGWTNTEFDNGALTSLGCSTPGSFASAAWGREIAGEVANLSLDSHLAGVAGVTTTSGIPHSTAVGDDGTATSSGLGYLGNDAWSSALSAGALSAINVSAGVTVPLASNLGAETEYARATSTGLATGASGAVTTSGGGLVSLDSPTSSTAGVGSLDLHTALASAIGSELAGKASQLADASLDIGALGSTTSVDSCNDLWQGVSDASQVARSYVLAKLALNFNSSLVGTTVVDTKNTVSGLGATLNALQPDGSLLSSTTLTTALGSALSASTSLVGVTLSGTPVITAGVDFDLQPVLDLVTGTITEPDGIVSINLGTGDISVDLAKLLGKTNLNGLDPNTKLITPAMLSTVTTDLGTEIGGFLSNTVQPAITAALNAAKVNVEVKTNIALGGITAANIDITVAGTIGQFVDATHNGSPTVTVAKLSDTSNPGLLGAVLFAVGAILGHAIDLDGLLDIVIDGLAAPLVTSLVPALTTTLVAPLLATATSTTTAALGALTTTLAPVLTSLGGVVDVLGDVVQVTVNAQPDRAGGVGFPEPSMTGALFESALNVSVLDGAGGTPVLGLFLGSSAVGPNTRS